MNHVAFRLLFLLFAALSLMDVLRTQSQSPHGSPKEGGKTVEDFQEFDDDEEPAYKYTKEAAQTGEEEDVRTEVGDEIEIRPPTVETNKAFKTPINMPAVRFLFCVSCGYRQAFDQFSQVLREKYPGVEVEGENYPPGALKSIIAQACFFCVCAQGFSKIPRIQVLSFSKIALICAIALGKNPFLSLGIVTPFLYAWMLDNKVSSCLMIFMLSNSVEGMLMSTGAFEIYLGKELIWSKVESGRVPSPLELFQAIDSHLGLKSDGNSAAAFDSGFDASA